MSTEKKRVRSKNFTDCDRVNLLEITADYLNTIENKRTDGPTIRAKNLAWDRICSRFNKIAQTGERTPHQLKALFDSIKKRHKDELNDKKNDFISISTVLQKYQEIIDRRSVESTNILDNYEQFDDTIVEEKDPLLAFDGENTENENSQESVINDNIKDNSETFIMPSIESREIENPSTLRAKRKHHNSSDDEKEQLKLEILRIRKDKEEIERDILLLKKKQLELEIQEQIKRIKTSQ